MAVAKKGSDLTTLYRGREGQWSWVLHRFTGVAVTLFLFSHIVDTALVAWGPQAYNRVLSVYHNPFVQLLELGLVGAVLFHALNGVRILIIDFWPPATDHWRALFWTTTGLFVLGMAPVTYVIGKDVLTELL